MQVIDITTGKKPKKTRLAAYCRVSSNSEEQLHSFAAQIRYYKDYARRHPEYTLVDVYADEGITGTSMHRRDELQRLLLDCSKGKIDRIIVKSVSRLARNTQELLATLRFLRESGVSVFFEEQGIDSEKLNSEMIITFPGMAAQQESVSISGNMRWSYKRRMEAGTFNCCAPAYGFDLADGALVVNEAEAAVVRRIFTLFLQGLGKQAIARLLNQENIPRRPPANKWYAFTIDYMLNNERYMGDALLQKFYTTETLPFKELRNRGARPQYYVENANPPIVSRETYAAVQALQKSRRQNTDAKSTDSVLRGTLFCHNCGHVCRRHRVRGKAWWICRSRAMDATACSNPRISETAIQDAFQRLLFKLHTHRQVLLTPLIRDLEIMQRKISGNHQRIALIDSELADLAARNLVIARLHTGGILQAADYAAQSAALSSQISALRSERRKMLDGDEGNARLDALRELYDILEEYEPTCSFNEELYAQIVEKISVCAGTELTFHLTGGIRLTETAEE